MKYQVEIPFGNRSKKGNYFGHKVCYDCGQVYDARFGCCINCGSDVWGNLRSYNLTNDGKILINQESEDLEIFGTKLEKCMKELVEVKK